MDLGGRSAQTRWAYGPVADSLMVFGWVPLFLAAHLLVWQHGAGADHRLSALVSATLLFSLVHQPLTLGLVYLDPDQRARQQPGAVIAPFVAVAVIGGLLVTGLWWLAVPVAAGWNVMHTVHQRYGLLRVYARKGGYGDAGTSARLDRALLYAILAAAVIVGLANGSIARQLARVQLDSTIHDGIADLTRWQSAATVLLLPAIAMAGWLILDIVRQEKAAGDKALAIAIAIDPVAGFVAYVAGHSLEYFVVVDRTILSRPAARGPLAWLAGGRQRPLLALVAVAVVLAASLPWLAAEMDSVLYNTLVFSFGVLHFWFDGRIWKLRRPAVAATFGIAVVTGRPPSPAASRPA